MCVCPVFMVSPLFMNAPKGTLSMRPSVYAGNRHCPPFLQAIITLPQDDGTIDLNAGHLLGAIHCKHDSRPEASISHDVHQESGP